MINLLYPTLPLGDDETPTSFLSRLARLHRSGTARMLAYDLGLNAQAIIDGDPIMLDRLAALSSASAKALNHNGISVENAHWRIRGQLMLKSSMQRTSVRLCPACIGDHLREGSEPYGRVEWQIVSIRTCAKHDLAILEAIDAPYAQYTHDFAYLVGANAEKLAGLAITATKRPISGFEQYLIDRLEGLTCACPWLDSLEFAAAARICEIIGAVALRGRTPKLAKMNDDDWQAAAESGFAIAKGGADAVRAWLSELQATYPYSRSGNEGPQAIYGAFYKFLQFHAKSVVFDPIRDLVRDQIVETMPIGVGEEVFGVTVTRRRLHSVFTAAQETGLHPKRLAKILIGVGVVDPALAGAVPAHQVFAAEMLAIVAAQENDSISQQQAETYLNAGRVHTRLLVDQGFIKALPAAKGAATRYSKTELDAFIARLLRDAAPVKFLKLPTCTIPAAAKRANCSAAEILRLILDKKLTWVGQLIAERGYLSVLVRLDEIKEHVHRAKLDGLTARELEKRLKTSTKVVTALVQHGHLTQATVVNPINRCPVKIIALENVERFERTYVSLTVLAAERGQHFAGVKATLEAAGVKPAIDRAACHATFYRRADVDSTQS